MVLTLLAIAGMNTASLELSMAGNHQYHNRAFEASEAGIDFSLSNGDMNPTQLQSIANTLPNSTDTYNAVIRPIVDAAGHSETSLPGFGGQFAAYQFEIQSIGTSGKNSSADHTQELYVIAPAPLGFIPPLPVGGGAGGNPGAGGGTNPPVLQ